MTKKKIGHRPKSAYEKRYAVRHTPAQMERWRAAAFAAAHASSTPPRAGEELQDWIRNQLDKAAARG